MIRRPANLLTDAAAEPPSAVACPELSKQRKKDQYITEIQKTGNVEEGSLR
jgi:hypothetical protein